MRYAAGFSLLEMLVVMALLGLLLAVVGPSFVGQLERSGQRFALDQLQAQMAQLPRWARLTGRPLKLQQLAAPLVVNNEEILSVPEGWSMTFSPPLIVSPNQICSESQVLVLGSNDAVLARYFIESPSCTASEDRQ